MENFEQIKDLVLHYLRAIWKNRWLAIAICWPVLVVGLVTVDKLKDRYTAETRVYIDTSSVLRPLLKGLAVESDFESNVQLMVRKLLSRPNLERVIRLMDMDIYIESPLEMELLVEKIKGRVTISSQKSKRGGSSGVYDITYQDENPKQAKKMVQILLDIFVEDIMGKSVKESDSAIAFLDKQILKYNELLGEAEQRLEQFKRDNVGVMPKDGDNYFKRLQKINGQFEQAVLEKSEAINRRDKLKSQIEGLSLEKAVEVTSSRYGERISGLEGKLEDLLLIYTDAHPDVVNTKGMIDSLEKKREEELAEVSSDTSSPVSNNPIYQQLQILLSETEAVISSLTARVSNYEAKKYQLGKFIDVIPRIESEFKKLNRDYDVHKKNYSELVARREQAKISEDVETGAEQIKFRIIEPPRVPNIASFPNRPLFDAIVLLVSLGVGYGIGLLVSLAKPVFYNVKDLRHYTGLPVLGSVIKFDTNDVLSKRKRNIFLFIIANIMLILLTAVAAAMHNKQISIFNYLQQQVMALI